MCPSCAPHSTCSYHHLYPDRIRALWKDKEYLHPAAFPGFLEPLGVCLSGFVPPLAKSLRPQNRSVCREGNKRDKSPSCHLPVSPWCPFQPGVSSTWIMGKQGSCSLLCQRIPKSWRGKMRKLNFCSLLSNP